MFFRSLVEQPGSQDGNISNIGRTGKTLMKFGEGAKCLNCSGVK